MTKYAREMLKQLVSEIDSDLKLLAESIGAGEEDEGLDSQWREFKRQLHQFAEGTIETRLERERLDNQEAGKRCKCEGCDKLHNYDLFCPRCQHPIYPMRTMGGSS